MSSMCDNLVLPPMVLCKPTSAHTTVHYSSHLRLVLGGEVVQLLLHRLHGERVALLEHVAPLLQIRLPPRVRALRGAQTRAAGSAAERCAFAAVWQKAGALRGVPTCAGPLPDPVTPNHIESECADGRRQL